MNAANFAGGFAGALTLTALHEGIRQLLPEAPRVDLIGIRAVQKIFHGLNAQEPSQETERQLALGGDLMANASYYSLAGNSYTRGALLGLAAGLGGIFLPGPMGLGEAPTNRTPLTQALTIGYYVAGGLVATAVTRALNARSGNHSIGRSKLKQLARKAVH